MKNIRSVKNIIVLICVALLAAPLVASGDQASDEDFFKNLHDKVALIVAGDYFGTGFVVTEDGFMLTAAHVVADKLMVDVIFNPGDETKIKKYIARTIISDYYTDIAVLEIISKKNETFSHLSFGDLDELVAGYSDINVIGYPSAISGRGLYVGSGKVTQKNFLSTNDLNVGYGPYIATNVIGGKGDSGGPCIYKNKVVGVAGLQISIDSSSNGATGLLLCVSGISAKLVLEKAIAKQPIVRGRLDITLGQFSPGLAKELDQYKESTPKKFLSQLFVVATHKSGLRPLDRIISITFSRKGEEYTIPISTITDFKRTIGSLSPSSFITVTIIRAGEEMALRLIVEPFFQGNSLE